MKKVTVKQAIEDHVNKVGNRKERRARAAELRRLIKKASKVGK